MEGAGESSFSTLLDCTKERSCNFSKEEVSRLQNLVEKYKNVLMCKKTDGSSAKQKDHAWRCIKTEYNAIGQTPRTIKQLKYKFENMKRCAKKEASRERQEMIRTGGGRPPTLPPASEDATNWLRSIMSTSIDGNEALFDDDVIATKTFPKPGSHKDSDQDSYAAPKKPKLDKNVTVWQEDLNGGSSTQENVEIDNGIPIIIGTDDIIAGNKNIEGQSSAFDCSTPHSSLKKPMAQPLKRLIKRKQSNGDNVIRQTLREKKLLILEGLQDVELEKIEQNIKQQKELHEQEMRHKEERHNLEMIKLNLEIEILKMKKQNVKNDLKLL